MTEEQDARIALMDHFRFFLQYWGTILVALAAAFLSIIQLRTVFPVDRLFVVLVVFILFQAGHTVVMLMFHGKLCELAVKEPRTRPAWDQSAYVTWLHATIIYDLNHEWYGAGKWLRKVSTWTGWVVGALASLYIGCIVSVCYDLSWLQSTGCLVLLPLVVATVVAAILIVRDHWKHDKMK